MQLTGAINLKHRFNCKLKIKTGGTNKMQQTKYVSTLDSADICNESSINDNLGDNKERHNALNLISYK